MNRRAPQSAPELSKPRKCNFDCIAKGFIFLIAFLLYANSITYNWVLDDYGVFKDNQYVTQGINGFDDILTKTYRHGSGIYSDNLYRPLSQLTFAIEWELFPDTPAVSHLFNTLYYALCCLLIFVFLRKILPQYSPWIPLLITLLFTAHPIHTEVVANIKSRDEIFSLLFILLTLLAAIRFINCKKKRNKIVLTGSVFLCFSAAMFSKEGSITMLAGIPLTLYFFTKAKGKDYIAIMGALVVAAALYIFVREQVLLAYPDSKLFTISIIDNYFYNTDLLTGWATAIFLLGKYLLLLFVPYPLVCDYSFNQLPVTSFADFKTLISLAIFLFLFIYAILQIKKKNPISYGILFFIIAMSITSNLVYRIGSSFAERFLFIPSIGFCIALIFLASQFFKIKTENSHSQFFKRNLPLILIIFLIVGIFSGLTVMRSANWKNQETLFGTDVKKSANSAHLRLYWGLALRDKSNALFDSNKGEKNWNKIQRNNDKGVHYMKTAIAEFKTAVKIFPEYAMAYEQLGLGYLKLSEIMQNNPYKDSAEFYFTQSIHYLSHSASTNNNLAKIYFERGEIDKAKHFYLTAIKLDPIYADAYANLGSCYGMAGQYDSSIYYFKKCLSINSKHELAISYLGLTYANTGKYEEAIEIYDNAIKYYPLNINSYLLKLRALIALTKWKDALQFSDKCLEISPFNSEIYLLRGDIQRQLLNTTEALQNYTLSIQYNPNQQNAYIGKWQIFQTLGEKDSTKKYADFLSVLNFGTKNANTP